MKRGVASAVARRAWDYLRYDFREIVWPRPMPDPPGKFPQISSMSPGEHLKCWRDGIGSYLDGWRWYNGEPKKERAARLERERQERIARGESEAELDAGRADWDQDLDGLTEELEGVVKAGKRVGTEAWKVHFKHFYKSRMTAYRDGIREFSGPGVKDPGAETWAGGMQSWGSAGRRHRADTRAPDPRGVRRREPVQRARHRTDVPRGAVHPARQRTERTRAAAQARHVLHRGANG